MKRPDYLAAADALQYERLLKRVPLFSGLNAMDMERISRLVIRHKYPKGKNIITEGQELEGFYIVISGQVKVYKLSAGGNEQILHIVSPGGTFAEAAAFTSGISPANAAAISDSECFFIFKDDLIKLIRNYPQISLNMMASLSQYLRHLVSMVEEISLRDVPARLAKYLLELMAESDTKDLKLLITKTELAKRLGTVSETLSRTLSRLKSKRIIKVDGSRITIINKEQLEQIAAGVKM